MSTPPEDLDLLRAKARQADYYMETALRLDATMHGIVAERDAALAEVARLNEALEESQRKLAVAQLALGFPIVAQHVKRHEQMADEIVQLKAELARVRGRVENSPT